MSTSPPDDRPEPDGSNPYGVPVPPPAPPAPAPYVPFPTPGQHVPMPTQNDKAVWALCLGIGSILGVFASTMFCFVPFGLMAGIPAVILGPVASKEIAASGGRQTGEGLAKAGLVCGVIGIVLTVIVVGLFAVGAIFLGIGLFTAGHA